MAAMKPDAKELDLLIGNLITLKDYAIAFSKIAGQHYLTTGKDSALYSMADCLANALIEAHLRVDKLKRQIEKRKASNHAP